MSDLTLKISDRAREWMLSMGGEFHVVLAEMNTPRGRMPLATCRIGAPKDGPDGWAAVSSGGVTVWASGEQSFINDEIVVDLYSVGMMMLPLALTAMFGSACSGGCESCSASCASRRGGEDEL
jgi:hypothetical protein